MILNKTILVPYSSGNKKYYESIGYKYAVHKNKKGRTSTKRGTTIEVKIEDLLLNSNLLVDVECDSCFSVNKIKYQTYIRDVRDDGKIYCQKCGSLNKRDGVLQNLLDKTTTFYDWCIENDRADLLERWDYDKNLKSPKEISYKSKRVVFFKCPNGTHNSEKKHIGNITRKINESDECVACKSFGQFGIDTINKNFIEDFWDFDLNDISPFSIKKYSGKNIWIKCQENKLHPSYLTNGSKFFLTNGRCPYCHGLKVCPENSLGFKYPKSIDVWSDKNEKTPYDYTPKSRSKVWWTCENGIHEDYQKDIKSMHRITFSCMECSKENNMSNLQLKVYDLITNSDHLHLMENNCTISPLNIINHIHKTRIVPLRYDNEIHIGGEKLIIEVHGIQHYELCGFHKLISKKYNTTPEYELNYQQQKDKYKKEYALSKGYHFLEIPYWTDDSFETWKILINDKIEEIKHLNNEVIL